MAAYSIGEARANLSRLIDGALDGEDVVVTRNGRPVVALRPTASTVRASASSTYDWLRARRQARKGVGVTSVDLLRQVNDDPAG